jgi:drug/metabolite transporter (DMT)-like permease
MLLLGERPTLTDIVGFALIFIASATVLVQPQEIARRPSGKGDRSRGAGG